MAKLKQLLSTSEFQTAQRQRTCSRNRAHKIPKGGRCLTVKENMSERSYCLECARSILQKAHDEVSALMAELPREESDGMQAARTRPQCASREHERA
jgi:hypothetical protein